MDPRRLCVFAAVLVISIADVLTQSTNDVKAAISFDKSLATINGTLRLNCLMTAGNFWAATNVVSWLKRQPITNGTYTVIRSGQPTFAITANRYSVREDQPAEKTFWSNLTITDFRREDFGFYSCAVTGLKNATSAEVFIQAAPIASVSINIASEQLKGVYVYQRNTSKHNTSCTSHMSGDTTNTSMQMFYSDKDVTYLFTALNETRVVGDMPGFQAVVSVRTLQSTSFAPPSDVQSPLECRVLLRDGTVVAKSTALIRSTDEGPQLSCSQDPPEAEVGMAVKITCQVSGIQLNQSYFQWTFERKDSPASLKKQIKLVDGASNDFAFAVPFAVGTQLTIRNVTSDVDSVNITLFYQGKEIATDAIPLNVKDEASVSSRSTVGSHLEWTSVCVILASILFTVYGR